MASLLSGDFMSYFNGTKTEDDYDKTYYPVIFYHNQTSNETKVDVTNDTREPVLFNDTVVNNSTVTLNTTTAEADKTLNNTMINCVNQTDTKATMEMKINATELNNQTELIQFNEQDQRNFLQIENQISYKSDSFEERKLNDIQASYKSDLEKFNDYMNMKI